MNKDLEQFFREEAQDLLLRINQAIKESEDRGSSPDVLQEVRRHVHTLKGSAHIAARHDVAQCAHELEDVIDRVAVGNGASSEIIHFTDRIAELLSRDSPEREHRSGRLESGDRARGSQQPETIHVDLRNIDKILTQVNATGNILGHLDLSLSSCKEMESLLKEVPQNGPGSIIPQQQVHQLRHQVSALMQKIKFAEESFERDHRLLRETVQDLRLVSASGVFIFVERAVRAAAEATGKQVEFETAGGEIQLDADVLFHIKDALIQMARNAVAHGIESVTTRRNAGKTAAGKVRLGVARHGRRITFSMTDDGVGIDPTKLRQRAVERGWLSAEAAETVDARQLNLLILRPGFTTSSGVSAVAGRGVGLDLVRELVASLKGEIRIESKYGQGTRIEIEVPTTITSMPILLATVGTATVGIPADSVGGIHVLSKLHRLNGMYMIDGCATSLVTLGRFSTAGKTSARLGIKIVAKEQYLLGVDAILGLQNATIRQLPGFIEAEPYLLGMSLESDAIAHVIIDPVILRESSSAEPPEAEASPALPILIIDDSLTTRVLEQSILTTAGYKVELACSAEEALRLAGKHRFGLFVVDVEMPGMDGFAFIAHTQQSPELRGIPSILVTSRNSKEDRERGVEVGAKGYFGKSTFSQKALLERVGELMGPR